MRMANRRELLADLFAGQTGDLRLDFLDDGHGAPPWLRGIFTLIGCRGQVGSCWLPGGRT